MTVSQTGGQVALNKIPRAFLIAFAGSVVVELVLYFAVQAMGATGLMLSGIFISNGVLMILGAAFLAILAKVSKNAIKIFTVVSVTVAVLFSVVPILARQSTGMNTIGIISAEFMHLISTGFVLWSYRTQTLPN